MYGQNIEVAEQVIVHLGTHMRDDMPLRTLKVLFHVAQHGPQTAADIAKGLKQPPLAIVEDLRALRKPGSRSKVRQNLLQEMRPVTRGKPCCYRLSKVADAMMDGLDFRMQVYALPEDDKPPYYCPSSAGCEDDDEPLKEWEASRGIVRG